MQTTIKISHPLLGKHSKPLLVQDKSGWHVSDAPYWVRTPCRPTKEEALADWAGLCRDGK